MGISDQTAKSHDALARSRTTFGQIQSFLRPLDLGAYLVSAVLVGVATLISYVAHGVVSAPSLTLIYLIAIVLSAQRYGLWPSIMASALSILAWDYFFTLPLFSLFISDERELFTLIIFMTVALIVSGMTAHIQYQNKQLNQSAATKARLYAFSQELAAIKTVEEIASFAVSHISALFERDVTMLLHNHISDAPHFVFSSNTEPNDLKKMTRLELSAELHLSEAIQPSVKREFAFFPLNALRGRIGAIRFARMLTSPMAGNEKQQIAAMLDQVAIAIERIWLSHERELSNLAVETERMRNTLLISVSHDLRTPLTTIIGSLSTLEILNEDDSRTARAELASIALMEAQRLDRFIGNLLDMTKLELGGLDVKLSPVNIEDVVESVLQRAQPLLQDRSIAVHIPEVLPAVSANFGLLEQAMFNVVDNAGKYSPIHTEVQIRAFSEGDEVVIQIMDQGDGIPNQLSDVIFQKFARLSLGDAKPPGTGLGLVVARGFLEVMGGIITAANRLDRQGAIFTIRLSAASVARI